MKSRFFILIAAMAIAYFSATFAHAQTAGTDETIPDDLSSYGTGVTPNDINLEVTPENPGAFSNITCVLDSDLVDLRRYDISWFIDSKYAGGGTGKTALRVTTKNYGQVTRVRAVISLPSGNVIKDFAVAPQDIAMIWEAVDAYAPAFYEGKKLPARESAIRIAAIPNLIQGAQSVRPDNAVYSWERNGSIISGASGYGLDSVTIRQNKLRAAELITLTASTLDNSASGKASISIPTFDPKILFYAIDPNTNIKSPLSKTSIILTAPSTILVAEPYNFSIPNGNPSTLGPAWSMNGNPVSVSNSNLANELSIRNPGGSGSSKIEISINNPATLFQSAAARLNVIFGSK